MEESYVPPPPPKASKIVSESAIFSNVFKLANQADSRANNMVRSRMKDLPLSEAAKHRDLMIP